MMQKNIPTITLIPHNSKVLLHIINNSLMTFLCRKISLEQVGFMSGRGTSEQILNVRQIIEKLREFNTLVRYASWIMLKPFRLSKLEKTKDYARY